VPVPRSAALENPLGGGALRPQSRQRPWIPLRAPLGTRWLGVIVKECFLDDPAGIVLAGIVLLPVDLIDIDADFFLDLFPGTGRHPAHFLDNIGKFLGVFGQTCWDQSPEGR
jgi:hypothetical protein